MAAGLTVAREKFAALEAVSAEHWRTQHRRRAHACGARHRRRADAVRRQRRADGSDRARGSLWAGQSAAAVCVSRASGQVRQGGGRGACALCAGGGGRLAARCVAFRAVGQPLGDLLQNSGGMPLHVAGHLKRDTWGGREKIELTDRRRRRSAPAGLSAALRRVTPSRLRPRPSTARVGFTEGAKPAIPPRAAPFVYRLGREIFILERGVRLP